MTGSAIATVILAALMVEGAVEGIKTAWPEISAHTGIIYILCVVISAVVCYATGAGIFGVLGVQCNPLVDTGITALIVARGSNHIFDIFEKFTGTKPPAAAEQFGEIPSGIDESGRG